MYNRYRTERKVFEVYHRLSMEMLGFLAFGVFILTYGFDGLNRDTSTVPLYFVLAVVISALIRCARLLLNFIAELEHSRYDKTDAPSSSLEEPQDQ